MEIKIMIDDRIVNFLRRHLKRRNVLAGIGLMAAMPLAIYATTVASDLYVFNPGEPILAEQVNTNFANLNDRIESYESVVDVDEVTGNVGIGRGASREKLQVHGALSSTLYSSDWGAGEARTIVDYVPDTNQARVGQINGSSGSGGSLSLVVANAEKVRVMDNGNVGIGTDSPRARLHVNGEIIGSNLAFADADCSQSYEGILFGSDNGTCHQLCIDGNGSLRVNSVDPSLCLR